MAKNLILKVSEKGAKKTAGALKKVGSAVADIGKKASLAGLGAGVLSTKLAGDFQKNLLEVGTLIKGFNENQLKTMSRELRSVSINSGLALSSISKAKYDIVSAGFSNAADSAKILEASSKLAVGGVTGAAEAADILTTALNAMGKTADDVDAVSDSLFTTVRLGKTTMAELASSLGQVLPFARSANLSLDGVNAAMATITASGISTAQATTSLRAALVSLTSPADSSRKAMEEAGIEVKRFDDGTLDLVGTVKQFQGLDPQTFKKIIPRVEAVLGIQTMANNFQSLTKNVKIFATESAGATEKAFDKMASGFNQQMSMLKNSIQAVMIEIGNLLISIIQPKIEEVNEEFKTLGKIGFDNLGKAIKDELGPILINLKRVFSLILGDIESRLLLTKLTIKDALDPFNSVDPKMYKMLKEGIVEQSRDTSVLVKDIFKNMYDDIIFRAETNQKEQELFDEAFANSKNKALLAELDALQNQLEVKRELAESEIELEETKAQTISEIKNQLSEKEKARIIAEMEDKNIFYQATLAAHDQFVNTLTDAEMHGAERRELIQKAVVDSSIRFLAVHTKRFIKNKFEELAIQKSISNMMLISQKSAAIKSFLVDKGAALGSIIVNMAKATASAIAGLGPMALIGAPAVLAAMAAMGSALLSKIESGQGALGFADGGIVPGINTGQGDTVPAMLTPGEIVLNQAQQENLTGNMGAININITGNVIGTEEFVRDTLLPEINNAVRNNLA
tara:strand:+ start:1424 stop:3640 length:2217 start_codon:yes stop_codon:yes gene_type:complete